MSFCICNGDALHVLFWRRAKITMSCTTCFSHLHKFYRNGNNFVSRAHRSRSLPGEPKCPGGACHSRHVTATFFAYTDIYQSWRMTVWTVGPTWMRAGENANTIAASNTLRNHSVTYTHFFFWFVDAGTRFTGSMRKCTILMGDFFVHNFGCCCGFKNLQLMCNGRIRHPIMLGRPPTGISRNGKCHECVCASHSSQTCECEWRNTIFSRYGWMGVPEVPKNYLFRANVKDRQMQRERMAGFFFYCQISWQSGVRVNSCLFWSVYCCFFLHSVDSSC